MIAANGRTIASGGRRRIRRATRAVVVLATLLVTLPGAAVADQASQPASSAAGYMATGNFHSCAVTISAVRCWGYGGNGQLGYGNTNSIGDDEEPGSVGPVALGPNRVAQAISAGSVHTCALLDDGAVRCWGFGANGRLGYGNTDTIGDDETPASAGPVDLTPGPGFGAAKAISAGNGHTCAIVDGGSEDGAVRCWGFGLDGRLGYGATDTIGDGEAPGSVAQPVDLDPGPGYGRAKAISAGGFHTCAILEDDTVRCWGFGGAGRLGYGQAGCPAPGDPGPCPADVGRTPATTPDQFGPVDLDPGPGVGTAKAISAGLGYTCAILGDDTVRCWGSGGSGQLGYGDTQNIGDDETPDSKGPVDLVPGPGVGTAKAIDAGDEHTCVVLTDDRVRCWGFGGFGQLGYGNTNDVGSTLATTPDTAGPVDLGPGRTATAITGGALHTCARLDDGSVRCWGRGNNGRLGYCKESAVGDNESPGSVGPVELGMPGIRGARCPVAPPPTPPAPPADGGGTAPVSSSVPAAPRPPSSGPVLLTPSPLDAALAAEKVRAAALSSCLREVASERKTNRSQASRLPSAKRRGAMRKADKRAKGLRKKCLRRHGSTPGPITGLTARGVGKGRIQLSFRVPGTDGSKGPAARSYLFKQSRRPIRTARDFGRAPALCKGKCSFRVTQVGAPVTLTVTDLRRGLYYYAVAARDNVSARTGPRSSTIKAKAR